MIDASELAAFGRDCIGAGAKVAVASTAVVRASATEMLHIAEANAPVLTGELRGSGQVIVHGSSAEVVFTSDHAIYVEEGTSVMAPEPYLGPAFDAVEPGFEQKASDGIVRGIL